MDKNDTSKHEFLLITKMYNKKITVPKEVREDLDIKDGANLLWVRHGRRYYIQLAEMKEFNEDKNPLVFKFS